MSCRLSDEGTQGALHPGLGRPERACGARADQGGGQLREEKRCFVDSSWEEGGCAREGAE